MKLLSHPAATDSSCSSKLPGCSESTAFNMQCTNNLYHKQLQQQLTRAPQQPQHLAAPASSIQCCFRSAPGRQALFRNLHHVLRPQLATCSSSGDL
jgi:hypothetical protein